MRMVGRIMSPPVTKEPDSTVCWPSQEGCKHERQNVSMNSATPSQRSKGFPISACACALEISTPGRSGLASGRKRATRNQRFREPDFWMVIFPGSYPIVRNPSRGSPTSGKVGLLRLGLQVGRLPRCVGLWTDVQETVPSARWRRRRSKARLAVRSRIASRERLQAERSSFSTVVPPSPESPT